MSIPLMEIELKVIEALREEFKRNQWCEEMYAAVSWSKVRQQWDVVWHEEAYMQRHVSDPDRNTAIDKARGVK